MQRDERRWIASTFPAEDGRARSLSRGGGHDNFRTRLRVVVVVVVVVEANAEDTPIARVASSRQFIFRFVQRLLAMASLDRFDVRYRTHRARRRYSSHKDR